MKTLKIKALFVCILLFFSVITMVNAEDAIKSTQATHAVPIKVITIKISGLQFVPAEITVLAGTKVRWVNDDPVDHDVTSGKSINGREARGLIKTKFPDSLFSSGLFGHRKFYEYTFQKLGKYTYYCDVHPFMTGMINVK